MSPLLAATGLATCFVVAGVGLRLLRDPGPLGRAASAAQAGAPAPDSPLMRMFVAFGERLAPRALGMLSADRRASIQHRIDAAGKPGGLTLERYAGRKAVFVVLLGGTGIFFALDGRPLMALLLGAAGLVMDDLWLASVARQRQQQIDRDLPDFLDVLAVTVGAGLGFRDGLARVSQALEGPLAEEMLVALRQMDLGASRRGAFEALSERNDSEGLRGFLTALLQAEELGAPLVQTLGQISQDMRRAASQRARQQAAKAAPRVSLVVTLMIVPAVVILLAAAMIIGSEIGFGELLG